MKATRLFAVLFVLFLMGTHAVFAVDHGTLAIHSELDGNGGRAGWCDRSGSDDPSARIGVRIFLSPGVAFDGNIGFGYCSEVDYDSVSQTYMEPGSSSFFFQGGVAFEVIKTTKTTLNVLARLGFTIRKWHAYAGSGGSWYEDKYEGYNVIIPSFVLALEPSYFFTDNMSAFANFGVMFRKIPNSQYVDRDDSAYNWDTDNFPLKDYEDGKTQFGTTGILIGFRFFLN